MSDISKIKVSGVEYNVKDSAALRDAPSDGKTYGRKNGAWSEMQSGGGQTYVAQDEAPEDTTVLWIDTDDDGSDDYYTKDEVDGLLDDKQPKTIADTAGYFTTDTVEGALAEIGAKLAAYPSEVWEGGSYGG